MRESSLPFHPFYLKPLSTLLILSLIQSPLYGQSPAEKTAVEIPEVIASSVPTNSSAIKNNLPIPENQILKSATGQYIDEEVRKIPAFQKKPFNKNVSIQKTPSNKDNALFESAQSYIQKKIVPLEASFFEPGVGLDPRSGMPYDHIRIRLNRGILAEVGNYTAASKLSLSIPFLLGVIKQKPAFKNIKMTPKEAEEFLARTLHTLSAYVSEFPDYGGFLPWVDIRPNGRIAPSNTKIPSLDNGQLTWSLAAVVASFEDKGTPRQKEIAQTARALLSAQNYMKFYDPARGLLHGTIQKDGPNGAWIGDTTYHLDDMFEGTLAVLWGVLHGQIPEETWYNLKIPTVDYTLKSGEKATTLKGFRASFHEHWALAFLPFMDSALAPIYENFLYISSDFSNRNRLPGFLSTAYDPNGCYRQMGIPAIAAQAVDRDDVAVVFATAMAMLISPMTGAAWLKNLYEFKNVLSKFGAVESVGPDGYADIFTADAKGMTLLAVSGGVVDEIRDYLWTHRVPKTAIPMYVRFMELVHAKFKQIQKERGGEPIHMPSGPFTGPPLNSIQIKAMSPPKDPGPEFDITHHLQKGHLHGKNVRSVNRKTLEDDVFPGKKFEFDFEIPVFYPYFDQWAFRGTYLDKTVGISKMNFLTIEIPAYSPPALYEIEMKSDDISLATTVIDASEPGVISADKQWKKIIRPIHPVPDAQYKAFNYFAVAIHDPHYLLGQYSMYGHEGRVSIRSLKLSRAHPVTGEIPKQDPLIAAEEKLFNLTPYWRISHGDLPIEVDPQKGLYSFPGGKGWRGGYTPYIEISKYKYLYLKIRNTSGARNSFNIELKHENDHLSGYKIPVMLFESDHWYFYRLFLPDTGDKTLNYFAISDPEGKFQLGLVGLANEELSGPGIKSVEFNPAKQKYRWYRDEPAETNP